MINIKTTSVLTTMLVLFSISCTKQTEKACTEMYSFITISIKDSLNHPIILDSNYTEITSNGTIIHETYSGLDEAGTYQLFSDSDLNTIPENKETEIKFVGIKDSIEVVNEKYVVTQDGCHVSLVSGRTSIVIK